MDRTSSKKFLVTGASSGIGLALCHYLLRRGDKVCGIARREAPLKELEKEYPNLFFGFVCDIQNKKEVLGCVDFLKEKNCYPEIAVLNAGVNIAEEKEPLDTTALEENFKVNVFGTFYFVEAFFDQKETLPVPHLVTLSSLASFRPKRVYISYAASKQAVNFIMEGLRMRLEGEKVKLTNIFLGPVHTAMLQRFPNKVSPGIPPARAAGAIVRAIEKNRKNPFIPFFLCLAAKAASYLPRPLYLRLVRWSHG